MIDAPPIHIAIMHDLRRADRLPRLLGWLGVTELGVGTGCTIGDGTRRGPWAAMKACLCDFMISGKPWLLLLEDDAEPTAGAVGSDQSSVISDQSGVGIRLPLPAQRGEGGASPGGGAYWNIREACAELVRGRWHGDSTCMTVHLCCTGGDAADVMDGWSGNHPESPTAPLYGEPVGTVAVLMSRRAAIAFRAYWCDWDMERAFEKTYGVSPDAGDARLWEMQRRRSDAFFPRRITTRSLVEHGCAEQSESLVRSGDVDAAQRVALPRRMHHPIEGITPLEWVRSFRAREPAPC